MAAFPCQRQGQGTSVLVSSPEVTEPAQVRYAWQSFTDANLYNGVSSAGIHVHSAGSLIHRHEQLGGISVS